MTVIAFKKTSGSNGANPARPIASGLLGDRHATIRHTRRGELVCSAIDPSDSVYYVRSGSVKLVRYSQIGDEVMIDQYQAGSLFGNLCFCGWSLCCQGIGREAAMALEDSEILVTTYESLKKNMHCDPDAIFALLEDYCRRLAVARVRIESLILHEAQERLARALLMMTACQQPDAAGSVLLNAAVTHEELARLIGVTRPFLTKLMGKLRNLGFIESLSVGQIVVHQDLIAKAYP